MFRCNYFTDESAQKTTLEVSSSIGIMDLKFTHSADLMNTPERTA